MLDRQELVPAGFHPKTTMLPDDCIVAVTKPTPPSFRVSTKPSVHHGRRDRLSRANPGPLVPCGTVRGTFVTMLERFGIPEFRRFWRTLPIILGGKPLAEAAGYRYLWEEQGPIHLHFIEEVNSCLHDFLFDKGMSHYQFYDEGHFRFKQGGMWSARESLGWIKSLLPKLYTDPDPKMTILRLVCEWGQRAAPGAACELPYIRIEAGWVNAIYSFAPNGNADFRSPFLFSRSTLLGMQLFPKFLGLTPFEETHVVADCLHPNDILKNTEWEISEGVFFIAGERYGAVVPFLGWAKSMDLQFNKTPIPEREVILIEKDFYCPRLKIKLLAKACVYDAPLFLAKVGFPRIQKVQNDEPSQDYLANILEGLSLDASPEWLELEQKYHVVLQQVEEKLSFEYRRSSQLMLLNGKTLMAGVPAMILRKILSGWNNGQKLFDFRAFKHDPEIFADSKRSSFETRWNRLREKLIAESPQLKIEKSGKGEFSLTVACRIEFLDLE